MIIIKPRAYSTGEESQPDAVFSIIGEDLEQFGTQIASIQGISTLDTQRLHQLRACLSLIRHLEEAVREYCQNLAQHSAKQLPFEEALSSKLTDLLSEAANAMDSLDNTLINNLREHTRRSNPELHNLRHQILEFKTHPIGQDAARTIELLDHFELSIWLLHRFVKVLEKLHY